MSKPVTEQFTYMSVAESLRHLDADQTSGLTSSEVQKRLEKFGHNEIKEARESIITRLSKKFWNPTSWMLEFIIMLSWVLGKYFDLYVVSALLLLNAILGFVQEQKASAALDSLKKKLYINARVLRERKWNSIPAQDMVPGDITRVRAGDFVPADLKIIEGDLEVDKSALTGESLTILQKSGDILYSGSVIKKGEATCVVISTGLNTYFGKTVQLVEVARPKLHTEEIIARLVRVLVAISGSLLAIVFLLSIMKGTSFFMILPLIVVLFLSAVPVALPAMFTITMALGALELARKGVLVTRLSASEDAATMSTLCVDKTGTLTLNRLTLAEVYENGNYKKEDVLLYGLLASNEANQDPIDVVFITAAKETGIDTEGFIQKEFVPFNPSTRRTEATVEKGKINFTVAKGSFSAISLLCGISDPQNKKVAEFAGKGYRVIAVSKQITENGSMDLVGIVGLYDKPREDSAKLVAELKDLGISTKMLTGDSLPIAKEIAHEVNIGERITKMADFSNIVKTDQKKASEIAENSDGFAEVYPEEKYFIVKALQSKDNVVGMTGDGVNDAPALRQAEVGIAVSNATDVAKGSASVILTKEGLSNIVDLIKTGRAIYQRVTTWIFNKIIKTFQIVVFVALAFLFTGQIIVSTFDIVLLLFLVDFVTISLATDNVRGSKLPDKWNINGLVKVSSILGAATIIESFGLLYIGIHYLGFTSQLERLHTFVFDILLFSSLLTILVVRERSNFWKSIPSRILLVTVIADILFSSIISVVGIPGLLPISLISVAVALTYCLVFSLVVNDFIKIMLIKKVEI